MAIELPPLPYAMDALAPHISKETLEFHYGKHHAGYVTKLNGMTPGTEWEKASLEQMIMKAKGGVFNNAAQIWNHTFYWNCMSPSGGGSPTGKIKEAIDKQWGSFDKFKEEFTNSAATLFGSGWTWLAQKGSEMKIIQEPNAGNPMTSDWKPILTWDVWEHAYYIDYRNARPKYIDTFWNLVNWDWANQQMG